MADLLYNFSQNANRGLLTNIGAGANQIVNQVRARKAEEAKMANYNGILKEFNTTHDPSLIPQLQAAYPEKFEPWQKGQAAMDEAEIKNLVQFNTKTTSLLGSGDPTMIQLGIDGLREKATALGDNPMGKYLNELANSAERGELDKVRTIMDTETGQSALGQATLESRTGLEAHTADQIMTSAQIFETMEKLEVDNPEERARLGEVMESMSLAQGKELAGLIQIAGGVDPKKMSSDQFAKLTTTLRTEYFDDTEGFRGIDSTKSKMEASLAQDTPQGHVGALFLFMKMLDENSVVRESEFRTASGMGSLLDKVMNSYEQVKTGGRLQPDQIEDLKNITSAFYNVASDKRVAVDDRMRANTSFFGVPEDLVFLDYSDTGEEVPPTSEIDGFTEFILNKYPNEGDIVEGKSLEELKKEYSNTYKDFLGGSQSPTGEEPLEQAPSGWGS